MVACFRAASYPWSALARRDPLVGARVEVSASFRRERADPERKTAALYSLPEATDGASLSGVSMARSLPASLDRRGEVGFRVRHFGNPSCARSPLETAAIRSDGSGGQPDCVGTIEPCHAQVVPVGLAVVVQTDAVELREGRVGLCHVCVRGHHVRLLGVRCHVDPAALAPDADGNRLARVEVVPPSSGGAEKEVFAVGEIGDRDRDASPGLSPYQVEGEQTAAYERTDAGCPQQTADYEVHHALPGHRPNPRLVMKLRHLCSRLTGHCCGW